MSFYEGLVMSRISGCTHYGIGYEPALLKSIFPFIEFFATA
jgi:hypothetical protein